ncbi:(2Fe-2S)-binding protein [Sulfurifustis variabilis]|uniref:Bacterioferritin-associated ferredoxin n=1 Tax=Sulfurifustis variabilis TaxID=1675686 RepID=A0A1C7AET7_9GAMM|nr:(2Fe-2S)-binding protein [Sulfurifustis variabilis]
MYVCVCNAVTDGQIREAVCKGACTLKQLCASLGVASRCGRCASHVREVLHEALKVEADGVEERAA